MTIAENRLLAYVDGLLSREEAAEIERALEGDAAARELVAALRASALPYRDAVDALLPVPDLSGLEAMIHAPPATKPRAAPRRMAIAAALVVVFAAGLVAGPYLLPPQPLQQAGLHVPGQTPGQVQWARWLDDIAAYQALYIRDTLNPINPPPERQAAQMARVSQALGQPIKAPDLTAEKADFKYARMYGIDGEPLAQIAYLPAEGAPFSLCMMKTDIPDHEPRYTVKRGMQMATWRHKGIAWVFVGGVGKADMDRYVASARAQIGAS